MPSELIAAATELERDLLTGLVDACGDIMLEVPWAPTRRNQRDSRDPTKSDRVVLCSISPTGQVTNSSRASSAAVVRCRAPLGLGLRLGQASR